MFDTVVNGVRKAMAAILDRIRSVAEYMQDHDLQLLHNIQ
jgi:hypothetical protein